MQSQQWQKALSNAITDPKELLETLKLDPGLLAQAEEAVKLFPLRVTRSFVNKMEKQNPHDPLLRQVLPLGLELNEVSGFTLDPLQEINKNPIPGLLHKYQGRVLLTVTAACGVNCRYCFRREFPYANNNPGSEGWEQALAYIAADSSIREVIFSGGDPLVAPDGYLTKLVTKIAEINHVHTLRIHSRLPIVLPERITSELLAWFTSTHLRPVMVIHCNHPNEIDDAVLQAMTKLRQHHVTLLNQTVLLKGINDSVDILAQLSEKLFAYGVLPYYLHLLDRVRGVAHFEVDEVRACQLASELAGRLPGYLVPKLVREEPGAMAKTQVFNAR